MAHCPSDLQSEREKLVTEFNDQGYRVLPEIQIDSKNVEKVAKDGLEAARLSVHLLGVESDSLAVRQARIAMELEKPLIAWSSKPELYIGETKYGNFLRELMEYQDPLRQSQYLARISDLAPLTARVYTLTRRSATISPPERGGG